MNNNLLNNLFYNPHYLYKLIYIFDKHLIYYLIFHINQKKIVVVNEKVEWLILQL